MIYLCCHNNSLFILVSYVYSKVDQLVTTSKSACDCCDSYISCESIWLCNSMLIVSNLTDFVMGL